MRRLSIFVILFALLITPAVSAAVIRVPQQQPTIQAGMDAASNGDTVLVADGTYTGPGNRDLDFGGKAITVKSAGGPTNCVIDCQGSPGNEHRGFYFHSQEGISSVVEGFTIRNGYADALDGGAIFCFTFCSPTITGNIITMNDAPEGGGGIMCDNASPVITYNTITYNDVGIGGGGIACQSGAHPIIAHNIISNNEASGLWGLGGGIYCWDASPTIIGNTISDNYTNGFNGTDGGGICLFSDSSPLIFGNVITGNISGFGGGIYTMNDGTHAPAPTIINNLIADNQARQGGGIYLRNNDADTVSITLTNNTISGNTTTGDEQRGGGICCWFGYNFTMTNNIFWGNVSPLGPEMSLSGITLDISYSDVQGGEAALHNVESTIIWGDGNLDEDPVWVASTGEYYLAHTATGHAQDSPCLDTGDPAGDMIWGTTRIDHVHDTGVVDMGYHYPWKSVSAELLCLPASGTVPFITQIGLRLTNTYDGFTRRVGAKIDVLTAGGMSIPNWKTGWLNLASGASFTTGITQTIPAQPTVIGTNTFTLVIEDVTPAPYNQPPYPPSGDTDTNACTVTGIAP